MIRRLLPVSYFVEKIVALQLSTFATQSVTKQTLLRANVPYPHNIYEVYWLSRSYTALRKSAAWRKPSSGDYDNEAKYDESYEMRKADPTQPFGIFSIFPAP
jgi:hypothetical protein